MSTNPTNPTHVSKSYLEHAKYIQMNSFDSKAVYAIYTGLFDLYIEYNDTKYMTHQHSTETQIYITLLFAAMKGEI